MHCASTVKRKKVLNVNHCHFIFVKTKCWRFIRYSLNSVFFDTPEADIFFVKIQVTEYNSTLKNKKRIDYSVITL